jgi:hypothetical protein
MKWAKIKQKIIIGRFETRTKLVRDRSIGVADENEIFARLVVF